MQPLRKHHLVALGLAGALMFSAAACGSSDSGSSGGSEGGGSSSEDAAVWKVCSDMPYEPFEMEGEGPRGLKYTGFDIELLDAIAEDQGATLDITDADFDTIFASVNAGNCDIVASAVTITPERENNNLFSEPYFDADQSLLVTKESGFSSLDDLAGKTIGVQTGTTGETYANENKPDGATVKAYPDASALFAALSAGEIQGVLQDLPVNSDRATKEDSVEVVETFKTGEQYGFAFAKDGTEVQGEVNDGLKTVKDDGTYDEIYEKYFPNAGS